MKSPIKADVFEVFLFGLLLAGFGISIGVTFIKPDLAANTIALASAIFSAAGVLGAYMSVREVRRDRLEKSQPFLIVEFKFRPAGIIDFILRNTSSNIARSVVVTFDPVPIALQDKPISEWSLFQHPFDMAPGAEEQNFFHVSHQFLNGPSPKRFTVTVDCQTESLCSNAVIEGCAA